MNNIVRDAIANLFVQVALLHKELQRVQHHIQSLHDELDAIQHEGLVILSEFNNLEKNQEK